MKTQQGVHQGSRAGEHRGSQVGENHPTGRPTLLYRNSSEAPLRVLSAVTGVFALGSALLAGMMLDSSVHISHHISFNERIFWAGGLLATFCGLPVAVWMYSRRLATGIDLSGDGRHLSVHTPTLLGSQVREVPLSALTETTFHEGDARGEESGSPPYIWVKVRNDRSFVVPLGGRIPNRAKLFRSLQPPQLPPS